MKQLSIPQIFLLVLVSALYFFLLWFVDRSIDERVRVWFRYLAVIGTTALAAFGITKLTDDHARTVDIMKAALAIGAAGCVFYEQHRAAMKRPVSERWKKYIGVTLAVAAIVAYFNGFRFGYPQYYHRWDQFHYYMGAKYFKEMGYDGLYKCSLIAQDELGVVNYKHTDGRVERIDMTKEVRHPDKKIRNLGGDNLLVPAAQFLENPGETCKNHFPPERWEKFKEDVKFFRAVSGKGYWEDMQKDHGYNPPPVWTIMGRFFAELQPASVWYCQLLSALDIVYTLAMFVALWWAFGWRVFAVGAIFWGCQSSAPFYWTGGAFLRQDWLFFLVLSVCLLRKKYPKLAGASLVYAGLLRIFPGLCVVGLLVTVGWTIVRKRKMTGEQVQMLLGGTAAAAVLIPLSLAVSGPRSYHDFYKHTLEVHDQTPLTNHMGLRVIIAHDMKAQAISQIGEALTPISERLKARGLMSPDTVQKISDVFHYKEAASKASGRMKFTKDVKLIDPFETWKNMRNERYKKYKIVAYLIIGLTLALSIYVQRRIKNLWVAQCLGQIWMILLSQLTCYYYSFMILTAPLTKVRRDFEAPLFGLAALSQFVWISSYWNDDKYTALTLISLAFCLGLFLALMPKTLEPKIVPLQDEPDATPPAKA
ncbi:hypothetical protein [Polyangium sp. y55x31]|uniref:hypothetical protein n=1 Tax=Polyangium sp. y55x31 TaxID=3042688 RepID=UPI0024830E1F|nr:hypothetical protein [Polyangium sp. y55x31]MDI1483171.1 hypothetical protein [Polyangium sp. y55x31]